MHPKYMSSCLLVILSYICVADGLQPGRFAELLNRGYGQPVPREMLPADDPFAEENLKNLKSDLVALAKLQINENNDGVNSIPDSGDVTDPAVRKRPFCNGFTGCGRIGKRSSLLDKLQLQNQDPVEAIAKRPFCNGFFGCGNPGKRLVFRNGRVVNRNILSGPPKALFRKRFFCNPGVFGCSNQGKRSPYLSVLARLRERLPGLISETN